MAVSDHATLELSDPSDSLTATIDLTNGATIRSLRTAEGVEVMAAGLAVREPLHVGDDFVVSGLTGYVDCLPTIEACTLDATTPPGPLVDHGALWSVPWSPVRQGSSPGERWLEVTAEVADWPMHLTRTVGVSRRRLRLEYALHNAGAAALPVLWAGHGLLSTPPGAMLVTSVLPRMRVTATAEGWSPASARRLLSELADPEELPVQSVPEGVWLKAVAPWPDEGVALHRPDVRVHVGWQRPATMPCWVGLWVNNQGFPPSSPLCHAAIEPSTGDEDSLARCIAAGTAWQVQGDSWTHWTVVYTLDVNGED